MNYTHNPDIAPGTFSQALTLMSSISGLAVKSSIKLLDSNIFEGPMEAFTFLFLAESELDSESCIDGLVPSPCIAEPVPAVASAPSFPLPEGEVVKVLPVGVLLLSDVIRFGSAAVLLGGVGVGVGGDLVVLLPCDSTALSSDSSEQIATSISVTLFAATSSIPEESADSCSDSCSLSDSDSSPELLVNNCIVMKNGFIKF
jgi:hypothetical protein